MPDDVRARFPPAGLMPIGQAAGDGGICSPDRSLLVIELPAGGSEPGSTLRALVPT
jgi:hypothetical protein